MGLWLTRPGIAGHSATIVPVSSRSIVTVSFTPKIYCSPAGSSPAP
jgi:hypothetical protein